MKSDESSWDLSNDVQLPENAAEIYDLLPTTIDLDPGYTALYRIQGEFHFPLCFANLHYVSCWAKYNAFWY